MENWREEKKKKALQLNSPFWKSFSSAHLRSTSLFENCERKLVLLSSKFFKEKG